MIRRIRLYVKRFAPNQKKIRFFDIFSKKGLTNSPRFDIISLAVAAMAQLVEHILGKDEVPGSNPGSSSRQENHPLWMVFLVLEFKTIEPAHFLPSGKNARLCEWGEA